MKKILFVATVVRMHINVFHTPYLKWFQDKGWETTVAARNDYENPEDCRIPYCDHYINIPFQRNPIKCENIEAYRSVKRLINKNDYDLVYCHTPVGAMIARLAAISSRKKGTRVVYMAHGFHFFKGAPLKNWLIYYPTEYFLSYFTDMILTINMEDYRAAKHFHSKHVAYVPGIGIDLERFQPNITQKNILRNQFNIPKDSFVLMSVGELSDRKNHAIVLEALAKLRNKNIYYVICGDGPNKDFLISRASELGVSEQLKLLGFRTDVSNLYNLADTFIFPSLQEGLPVSVMEAMAMGLPVISSKIRGSEDLIDPRKGGYLVQKSDVNGYAKAINNLLCHLKDIEKFGNYNRSKVKQYGLDSVLENIGEKLISIM